jgi:hypothetical protein
MRFSRFATFALALLLFCMLAASAGAAPRHARARSGAPKSGEAERTVTRTGPDGTSRTSTQNATWQRGGGHWTRNTVYTGPAGKQSTTHVDGAKTQDGAVRDVTRTGPNGKTSTTHDELHKTDGGYTRETTHTGPNGGVTTSQGQGAWDPATKTWTRDRTVTHPNGSTSSTEVTRTVTPVTSEAPAAQ